MVSWALDGFICSFTGVRLPPELSRVTHPDDGAVVVGVLLQSMGYFMPTSIVIVDLIISPLLKSKEQRLASKLLH